MTEAQQIVADVKAVTPYIWEVIAFFGILASLTITQWIKKIRCFPMWMCNMRPRKDGTGYYRKLKRIYLRTIATGLSFAIVSYCLYQRYPIVPQIFVVSGIIAIMQFTIVEVVFRKAEAQHPELAGVLRDGLYIDGDETVFTKIAAVATGGGVDKRKNRNENSK